MPTGTVKWFNDEKGFGFVTPDETGKDLFVHHSGIAGDGFKSLTDGTKVEYEAEATDEVASKNADARKTGRKEREAYERGREKDRRSAAAKRDAKLMKPKR